MIALACDHHGVALKQELMKMLDEMGLSWKDFGTYDANNPGDDYPIYGYKAAQAVASGECDRGILICGTGIGMSMCANKFDGIRAALCSDTYSARLTRNHNDANVICLGARVIGSCLAQDILDSFLSADFEGGRHAVRVGMITDIENGKL